MQGSEVAIGQGRLRLGLTLGLWLRFMVLVQGWLSLSLMAGWSEPNKVICNAGYG